MNRMSPEVILGRARDFMESRILLTGAELNLFTLLTPVALSAEEITARIGADLRAVTILLDALAAMDFVVKQAGKYHCPPSISPFLSAEAPDSILPMILHMAHVWERWAGLTRIVKGLRAREEPTAPTQDAEELRAFIGAMHAIAARIAPRIVAAVNPGQSRLLLDVGGGSGTYMLAFLQAVPEMRGTLFDRPAVIEMARERLSEAGVLDRVRLVSGNFYEDEFPTGHDLAFVSAIIHQNSPEQNLDLFQKVFRALTSGGRIIIRDHVMASDRTRPKDGAIFAVNMLVGTSGGNTYTFDEIQCGLTHAGFIRVRLVHSGEHMDGLVEGLKP
jgi:predicted O-methyltransferase YrrM